MIPKDLPDILFISVDAMRRDCMAPYGADLMPAATRLLFEGVAFDRCVSAAPWTGSSFGTIFTGLWPRRHGFLVSLRRRGGPMKISPLGPDARLLAEMLKAAGYHTMCSQGNGGCCIAQFGIDRGFDEYAVWEKFDPRFQGWANERRMLRRVLAFGGLSRYARLALYRLRRTRDRRGLPDRSPVETAPGIADAALSLLRRAPSDKPAFLWANFMDMHEPYCLPPRLERTLVPPPGGARRVHLAPAFCFDEALDERDKDYMRSRYDLTAQQVNKGMNMLLDRWAACRRKRPRLTVFVSDHGEEFWDHGTDIRNESYDARGVSHGHTLFGELIDVPWIVHWPQAGVRPARIGGLASTVDIVPTLVDLLALTEDTRRLPGVSQARSITAGAAAADAGRIVFADSNYYGAPRQAAISATHKLLHCPETGEAQLFAWGEGDPKEKTDLAKSPGHKPVAEKLAAALDRWNAELADASPEADLDEEEKKVVAARLKAWGYL